MDRKPDDDAIAAFLAELAAEPWLDKARRWWPSYLFHVTDVCNLPSIAAAGRLLCRSRAIEEGQIRTDSASSEIIAQTPSRFRDHVRLYFRPRTPTFYRNEGIRPLGQRPFNAHCPIPVALLFDARHVLGMKGARFSDGNLARSQAKLGEDVAFLRQMPFRHIYHDTSLIDAEKDEIVFRRHAEVIIFEELPLLGLRHVYVRSVAEFETLDRLLDEDDRVSLAAYEKIRERLRVNTRAPLFFNKWTYVERVDLIGEYLRIIFNPPTHVTARFTAMFQWEDMESGRHIAETATNWEAFGQAWRRIPDPLRQTPFRFRLDLDDSLAYVGTFMPGMDHELLDVPF